MSEANKANEMARSRKTIDEAAEPVSLAPYPEIVYHNPVVDLDAASHALTFMADKFDSEDMYGEAALLRLVGRQVQEITRYIDEENWEPQPRGARQ